MVYRIRYRASGTDDTETEVEANSPAEAVIKFQHTHKELSDTPRTGQGVVSVTAPIPQPELSCDFEEPAVNDN